MRLLLIEDSRRLQELLGDSLHGAGYRFDIAGTAAEFRSYREAVPYDLFIVDLGLPDGDGLTLIREMRREGIATPILVITARASVGDRVLGLDSGADDYLIKPFSHQELLARVRALMRRPAEVSDPVITLGNTVFDEASGEVRCNGTRVGLRLSERRLLALLMRRAGAVVAKASIETALSDFNRELTPNAVEALVSRLRRALGETDSGLVLETVRGVGYMLRDARQ